MNKTDYIIIGGGIIGMMTARELALQGANVTIFDRGDLGREASSTAGGILSSMRPWAEAPASFTLSEQGKKLYPEYTKSLQEETGIDSEYITSGLVIIDKDHAEKTQTWAKNGKSELVEKVKNDSDGIFLPNHAVLLSDIGQVRPPMLLKALRKCLEKLSVSIYENTEVTNVSIKEKQFQFVEYDGGRITADAVIVTAGVWSKSIIRCFDKQINIKPIRGQIVCVKSVDSILDKMILDDAFYLIPRKDGHFLIGSTMEDVGFNNETTKIAGKELLNWAYALCPALKQAKPVSHWAGLRPFSATGLPIIGQANDFKGIYYNTGHFRKGILQAPASAELLVNSILGKPSFMEIKKFNESFY